MPVATPLQFGADGACRCEVSGWVGRRWSLGELHKADDAVRLGGALGVGDGSDTGIGAAAHNAFMYSVGSFPSCDN